MSTLFKLWLYSNQEVIAIALAITLAITIVLAFFVIRAICKYQAKLYGKELQRNNEALANEIVRHLRSAEEIGTE